MKSPLFVLLEYQERRAVSASNYELDGGDFGEGVALTDLVCLAGCCSLSGHGLSLWLVLSGSVTDTCGAVTPATVCSSHRWGSVDCQ